MDSLILITTTSDDRKELDRIGAMLVQEKLAACCQVGGPITSHYTWNGELESSEEWVCSIKTLKSRFTAVAAAIAVNHHYDEPQIIAIEICGASEGYETWVRANVAN